MRTDLHRLAMYYFPHFCPLLNVETNLCRGETKRTENEIKINTNSLLFFLFVACVFHVSSIKIICDFSLIVFIAILVPAEARARFFLWLIPFSDPAIAYRAFIYRTVSIEFNPFKSISNIVQSYMIIR